MDRAAASPRTRFKPSPPSSQDGSTAAGNGDGGGPKHPFENSDGLLVVFPNDAIDVEEEARLYDELCAATQSDDDDENYLQILKRHETHKPVNLQHSSSQTSPRNAGRRPRSSEHKPPSSILSNDIWLGDNSGTSSLFAREVEIRGWTSVGDKLGGAYIVYECVVRNKEGNVIHTHKRYNAFEELFTALHHTLPRQQHRIIPPLPPKVSLAKYRSTFLEKRRRLLQHWLSSVLLHPDLGGCQAVRSWLLD